MKGLCFTFWPGCKRNRKIQIHREAVFAENAFFEISVNFGRTIYVLSFLRTYKGKANP